MFEAETTAVEKVGDDGLGEPGGATIWKVGRVAPPTTYVESVIS